MRIPITGGAGSLAARLIPLLIQRGDEVVLLDVRCPQAQAGPVVVQAELVNADLDDQQAVFEAVR